MPVILVPLFVTLVFKSVEGKTSLRRERSRKKYYGVCVCMCVVKKLE